MAPAPTLAIEPGRRRAGSPDVPSGTNVAAVLDFLILGPLEVRDGDRVLPLGGHRQRALLGALLLHRGEVVAVDRLVDALWGERPPPTASTALQNGVSQLRKLLGPEVVETRRPGYALRVDPERIDAVRAERLAAAAAAAEPERRAALLREALALWRGPALADLELEAFAAAEARRLEERRSSLLEDRIEADLALGRHAEVTGELEALVARHPLRERLRALLMLALYRSGRQVEALQAFAEARGRLVEELGIEPGPELRQVHASILRQSAALSKVPAPASGEDQLDVVARALLAGRLVPVLGGDVNLIGRDERVAAGGRPLPVRAELAARLAERFDGLHDDGGDLARAAQHVAVRHGVGPLHEEVQALLAGDVAPGPVHEAVAELTQLLVEADAPPPVVVTTNLDPALEAALDARALAYDVVAYIGAGRDRGRFVHAPPGGAPRVVDLPNAYAELRPDERPVVVRIQGRVAGDADGRWGGLVLTEDDHIGYLAGADLSAAMPVTVVARLRRSHLLFLGHPLRQWSVRVFLQRLWVDGAPTYRSWAVQPDSEPIEHDFWRERGVVVLDAPLDRYVRDLVERVRLLGGHPS